MGLIRHLNPLEYKIIGFLEFKIEAPLHIGTGAGEARRAFVRILGDKGFLIPSSTWKGAFRAISEMIARKMGFRSELTNLAVKSFREEPRVTYEIDEKLQEEVLNVLRGDKSSIIPYSSEGLIEVASEIGFTHEEIDEIRDRGFNAHDNLLGRLTESILAIHCPIGKLYGNHVLAGKLRFFDTILEQRANMIHERFGIAIDRCSGRVKNESLFILESIVGGEIKLKIIADNLTPGAEDSKLFASTLEVIKNFGICMGARKSVGMGVLTLNSESSQWYIINLKDDKSGVKIANPFKYAEKIDMESFLKWLWS